jgi:hypothetical protein
MNLSTVVLTSMTFRLRNASGHPLLITSSKDVPDMSRMCSDHQRYYSLMFIDTTIKLSVVTAGATLHWYLIVTYLNYALETV